VATAYTSHVLGLMSEIAETLGNKADAAKYAAVSERCKKAYQALVETEDFSLDTDRQACLVRPLAFGLLSETQTEYAKRRLLQALENYGYRLGTGFLSTPLILGVLEQFDLESAYKLLENEQMPGWLYMTKIGATTIWESWEGTEAQGGIASLNHYSKGAVCEWLFSSMCGINVSGENHFTINPKPGGTFTFAEAAYNSIFGTIKSGWKKANEGFVFAITVPANCTADVTLPDGTTRKLPAGEHTITI
ncbi:MAG: alfa-L-rhamnosidase, partial [Clostridia bacterium]|nr:alfa-L-rhamnosidase [Clostridia bacterium]